MEYWSGTMNWPVDSDWVCETCQHKHPDTPILVLFPALTWGLVNGVCRCDICHTHYSMKDENGNQVTCPLCLLKPEYKSPARLGWLAWGTPISEWTDARWDKAFDMADEK